jgi:nitrogen regulatory protein PII
MKMFLIVSNIGIHKEVIDILKECGVSEYTRIERAQGVGKTSGPHLGTNVWPSWNNIFFAVVEDEKEKLLLEKFKEAKEKYKKEGLKVFVIPVENEV